MNAPHFSLTGVKEGVIQSIPIAISVFSYGIVFGVLASEAAMSLPEVAAMSLFVFAGAAQFVALDLWVAPLPVLALVLTTFVVNIRHTLMGIALQPYIARLRTWQVYLSAFFMTDENWALSIARFKDGYNDKAFLLGSGLAVYVGWFSASVLGYLLGRILPTPEALGLDFIFIAVFIGILAGMWKPRFTLSWLIAGVVAVAVSYLLPGYWYIIAGGLAGSIAGVVLDE